MSGTTPTASPPSYMKKEWSSAPDVSPAQRLNSCVIQVCQNHPSRDASTILCQSSGASLTSPILIVCVCMACLRKALDSFYYTLRSSSIKRILFEKMLSSREQFIAIRRVRTHPRKNVRELFFGTGEWRCGGIYLCIIRIVCLPRIESERDLCQHRLINNCRPAAHCRRTRA